MWHTKVLLRDCYFLPQSLDAGDCFVRLILLSHNTCLSLVLYLPLYCVCESNANKIMVPTKFDKNKIASLVNFVMPLKGQRGFFFFFPILLILFSDGIKSHSPQGPVLDRAGAESSLPCSAFLAATSVLWWCKGTAANLQQPNKEYVSVCGC